KLAYAPLLTVDMKDKIDISANVAGGGTGGQAVAVAHGIARALQKLNPELRPALKKAGHLTRDPRERERKKAGQPGARKRFQFSKR
ncbi:MAG TPA: 30S ribosomal protein S9, partial [Opitutaceae bacterium]|nr:30S ribosomal protein S9 [Opitutaceae bacterium]